MAHCEGFSTLTPRLLKKLHMCRTVHAGDYSYHCLASEQPLFFFELSKILGNYGPL